VGHALDASVCDRIIAETRGNPLALLELPRGLTPTQLAGGFGVPEASDLPNRIEASYARRIEGLPGDARSLLLVAAAEPVGDPLLLQRACERLGIALSAVDGADGLPALDERVTFRHLIHYGDDRHWLCGDRGVSEWTIRGTQPRGERIEVRGCDLFEFVDGRISRKDSFWKIVD
jgi:hypothetical protein